MIIYREEEYSFNRKGEQIGDIFSNYTGTDRQKAIDTARYFYDNLTEWEKKRENIEVQVFEIPDNIDITDEEALFSAMFDGGNGPKDIILNCKAEAEAAEAAKEAAEDDE